MSAENKCPLCGCSADTRIVELFESDVNCNICGKYTISELAKDELNRNGTKKIQLSHLLAEMKLKKISSITIIGQDDNEGNFKASRKIDDILRDYPKSVPERMDRALCNLARLSNNRLDTTIKISYDSKEKKYLQLFAEDQYELREIINYLNHKQYINDFENLASSYQFKIKPTGWSVFSNLEKKVKKSNYAFIAMWFDDSTKLFATQAHEAIEKAGYECKIVNQVHHNNYIMDEVINLINDSRFIIADFTCIPECNDNGQISGGVRGGVYYEAGFAKGLGKDVIVTCRNDDDSQKRRHFDIDQLNTIFWRHDKNKLKVGEFDFVDFLCERIKATVGAGANIK